MPAKKDPRVVLLGDTGVGKTLIARRIVQDVSSADLPPTTGPQLEHVKHQFGDKLVTFQLWDTAGQEKYRAMAPVYCREATAALFVFSIVSSESFQGVKRWFDDFQELHHTPLPTILVGNKVDLDDDREVTEAEATAKQEQLGCRHYIELSALTGRGISDLLDLVSEMLLIHAKSTTVSDPIPELVLEPANRGGHCC
jgi:small GTP-binding protein